MNAFRNTQRPADTGRHTRRGAVRLLLVLGLLALAATMAAGCTVTEDLATTTTVTSTASPTASSALATTTTALETTTTLASSTTTETAGATTTTESPTTTVPENSTTSTTLPDTGSEQTAGTVLYQIDDWSAGISGWAAAGQWKTTGGMLVTDGTSDSFAVAPVDLTGYPDYAVECEAQIIDPEAGTAVLMMARLLNGTAYYGGFDGVSHQMVVGYDTTALASAGFVMDSGWHTYRLEVRGNSLKLFLEQAEVARAIDNTMLEPGTVGVYCGNGQINVRSFSVTAL